MNKLRRSVALDRMVLHQDKYVSRAHADLAFQSSIDLLELVFEHLGSVLVGLPTSATAVKRVQETVRGVMAEMMSWHHVESCLKKTLQLSVVEPNSSCMVGQHQTRRESLNVSPRKDIAQLSIISLLARMMQSNRYARTHILTKSNEWKAGALHGKHADTLTDLGDGDFCRFHPHLMREATPSESEDVRIALYEYTDEFTTTNPIGTKRGDHKYSAHAAGVLNLPIQARFNPDYILPHLLVQYKLLKKMGLPLLLCGADDQVEDEDEEAPRGISYSCFASEMRALDKGVFVEVPNDNNGGTMWESPSLPLNSPLSSLQCDVLTDVVFPYV